MPPKTIYIAGPMTGIKDFNYPAFDSAEKNWIERGWLVSNPTKHADGDTTKPYSFYIRASVLEVLEVDALALLPGWQNSKGANLEYTIATLLDLPIYDALTYEVYKETALDEARRIVHGARVTAYGHPINNFTMIGRMWGAVLKTTDIKPEIVGLMLALLKVAREVNKPQRDNRVDLMGYAETVEMVHEYLAEEKVRNANRTE